MHVVAFVTIWLQTVLGVKQLRDKGVTKSVVTDKSTAAAGVLQSGRKEEVRLIFEANKTKTKTMISVVLRLALILSIQKHDLNSPTFEAMIKSTVDAEINSAQVIDDMIHQHRATKGGFEDFVANNNSHCFTLPFKSSDASLLKADDYSRELSSRTETINSVKCNGDR